MATIIPSFLRRGSEREPFPFVVGMNRSGTTLLRMMLDAHPDLTIPPETHFVPDTIKAAKADGATPESVLEAMKAHREWGDFEISDEEMLGRFEALPKLRPGPAVRSFYDIYSERVLQVKGIRYDFGAGETVVESYYVPSIQGA